MGAPTQNDLPLSTVGSCTTPVITNKAITLANTEYSHAIPAGAKKFSIKLRNTSIDLKIAFASGTSGTTYYTLKAGMEYTEENINADDGLTLYFQSATAAQVAEIKTWN